MCFGEILVKVALETLLSGAGALLDATREDCGKRLVAVSREHRMAYKIIPDAFRSSCGRCGVSCRVTFQES
jgi:hypothetical protein